MKCLLGICGHARSRHVGLVATAVAAVAVLQSAQNVACAAFFHVIQAFSIHMINGSWIPPVSNISVRKYQRNHKALGNEQSLSCSDQFLATRGQNKQHDKQTDKDLTKQTIEPWFLSFFLFFLMQNCLSVFQGFISFFFFLFSFLNSLLKVVVGQTRVGIDCAV